MINQCMQIESFDIVHVTCIIYQFTRPTRDTYIRIFGEEGDEVVSINVRISAAVTYPNDTLDYTLIFDVNICQLPVNHTFYIVLDAGELS